MQKHLVELLTEGKFTTIEVHFPHNPPPWAQTQIPAPPPMSAQPAPYMSSPSPGRVHANIDAHGRVQPKMPVLQPGDFEKLAVAFPFIHLQVPAKTYTYKVSLDVAEKLKTGDDVIVPDRDGKSFIVARVWIVHPSAQIDYEAKHEYRWVVQRVDTEQYAENLTRENDFKNKLLESERNRLRAETRRQLLASIAPSDPEAYASFVEAMKLLGVEHPESVVALPENKETKV